MNHIMLRAEFPGAEEEQLAEIHASLKLGNWVPVTTPDEKVTIWYGTFNRSMREEDCHRSAIDAFIKASEGHCRAQLDVLWAAKKPAPLNPTLIG